MPDEYERLRKRIEEGLAAADELQRKLEAAERNDRSERKRKLKLIKGSLIWGAIVAGVEWLRDYRRFAGALAVSGLTVTGAVIAQHPGLPGANDPPSQVITPPPSVVPPTKRPVRPSTALTPRRTSPPRTQAPARIAPPPDAPPSTVRPTETKEPTPVPTPQPTKNEPIVSLPVTPTIIDTVTPTVPVQIATPDACTINLLGIKLCLPLG